MNKKLLLTGASLGSALLLCAATSGNRKPDLSKVDFATEAGTVSDPSDIHLYLHEEIVNSFLSIKSKFGRGRVIEMHYNNQHLATHSGTTAEPNDWQDASHHYKLSQWGLLGDINETTPTVYYLASKEAALVTKAVAQTKKAKVSEEELTSRHADAFERYANEQLAKGEKLVKWERPEFVRFVGGIYAAKSCLSCHADAKEGQVLGAFSYQYNKTDISPTDEVDPLVKAARAGQSYQELLTSEAKEIAPFENAEKYYVGPVSYRLAIGGVVLPEMIDQQKKTRDNLLEESTQLSRPKVKAKSGGIVIDSVEKSAR